MIAYGTSKADRIEHGVSCTSQLSPPRPPNSGGEYILSPPELGDARGHCRIYARGLKGSWEVQFFVLVAIAPKIIILDFEKTTGAEIIGLAIAMLTLSISYWIIRCTNPRKQE